MSPEELREHLIQRPFQPFRMYVTDGASYDVRHPDLLLVGKRSAVVGLTSTPEDVYFERTARVDLLHIVRLEPLSTATKPSSGNGASE
jgi:hypothetical protein